MRSVHMLACLVSPAIMLTFLEATLTDTIDAVPRENPGYYTMSEEVLELLVSWIGTSQDIVMPDPDAEDIGMQSSPEAEM